MKLNKVTKFKQAYNVHMHDKDFTICRGFLYVLSSFPSLLWHCWLGDRKGIQSAKKRATYPQSLSSKINKEEI